MLYVQNRSKFATRHDVERDSAADTSEEESGAAACHCIGHWHLRRGSVGWVLQTRSGSLWDMTRHGGTLASLAFRSWWSCFPEVFLQAAGGSTLLWKNLRSNLAGGNNDRLSFSELINLDLGRVFSIFSDDFDALWLQAYGADGFHPLPDQTAEPHDGHIPAGCARRF